MSVVFTLKYILGPSIFVSSGSEECRNGALNVVDFSNFSSFGMIGSYQSGLRGILTTKQIWSGVGGFARIIMSLLYISCMFLIWFNIDMFSWMFFLKMFLSMQAVFTRTLLYFPVDCCFDRYSITWWTVVGSFIPILIIHTLVLFIAIKSRFQGIFFADWEIYDMLWGSQYCTTIPKLVPLGVKLTVI